MPLSFTLDTVGPLAQTAEDCAIVLSVIAGPDPLDPTTALAPKWDAKAMKRPAKGMTIGIPKSFYVDDLEPDVAKALDDAIATFKTARREGRAGRAAGSGDGVGRRA